MLWGGEEDLGVAFLYQKPQQLLFAAPGRREKRYNSPAPEGMNTDALVPVPHDS
jgi:hypothetical protein